MPSHNSNNPYIPHVPGRGSKAGRTGENGQTDTIVPGPRRIPAAGVIAANLTMERITT